MSFCLKAATELADDDLDAITSTIEQAMKGGMDDKAAELLAVNDQLAVVELERRELVQLIQAQHGGKLKAKAKTAPGVIEDVGEKIGGARKDTAMSGFTRGAKSEKDDRPSWARRFQISQIVTPGGMLGDVNSLYPHNAAVPLRLAHDMLEIGSVKVPEFTTTYVPLPISASVES
jgi:hypothetical protein